MEYRCDFYGLNEETIPHLVSWCIYSRIFLTDLEKFLTLGTVETEPFPCFVNFEKNMIDKKV